MWREQLDRMLSHILLGVLRIYPQGPRKTDTGRILSRPSSAWSYVSRTRFPSLLTSCGMYRYLTIRGNMHGHTTQTPSLPGVSWSSQILPLLCLPQSETRSAFAPTYVTTGRQRG